MAYEKRLVLLRENVSPLDPEDAIPEAVRKILLENYIKMLSHEEGSRTGEDIESVHKMRVATRQMRSALRVFGSYFIGKRVQPYKRVLRATARYLGAVRDLDVMIESLNASAQHLDEEGQAAIAGIVATLDKRRIQARKRLVTWFDSKTYRKVLKDFTRFLLAEGHGSVRPESDVMPFQVRHVVPTIFYERLAAVRAYDTIIPDSNVEALHALRIEFKRLRYTISFFEPVLGTSATEFIEDIRTMQDYLGHLNDVTVAHRVLDGLNKLSEAEQAARDAYLAKLEAEEAEHVAGFPEVWNRFNSRTVQRKFSEALLVLR